MRKKERTKRLDIKLTEEEKNKLDEIVAKYNTTISLYVRKKIFEGEK